MNLKNAGIEVRTTQKRSASHLDPQRPIQLFRAGRQFSDHRRPRSSPPARPSWIQPATLSPSLVRWRADADFSTVGEHPCHRQSRSKASARPRTRYSPTSFPIISRRSICYLPLRNRSAQADNARAMLTQRQLETQLQQLRNAALLDVRNTYIALQQDRARVDAAIKARELQKQTFEAEQKKYTLGASTVYNVILTQRDYVTAQGTELRALSDLVEAKANFERAVGRTLEVNRVTIANSGTPVRRLRIRTRHPDPRHPSRPGRRHRQNLHQLNQRRKFFRRCKSHRVTNSDANFLRRVT